jgi:hypothetical protein
MEFRCSVCGQLKSADDFRRGAPKKAKGKPCKKCDAIRNAEWNKAHPDKRKQSCRKYSQSAKGKERYKKYTEENAERLRANWSRWYQRHKEDEINRQRFRRANERRKYRARELVAYAVKTGKLIKLPCSVCGSTKSEAHHPDYSKALDVVWLCSKHHAAIAKEQ